MDDARGVAIWLRKPPSPIPIKRESSEGRWTELRWARGDQKAGRSAGGLSTENVDPQRWQFDQGWVDLEVRYPFFSDKAREFELVNGAECDGLRSRIWFILKQHDY